MTPPATENVAKCYNVLDDGPPTPIQSVRAGNDELDGSSGNVRTCVSDLLGLYSVFLASANDQFSRGTTSTQIFPLTQINDLMSAKIPIHQVTRG